MSRLDVMMLALGWVLVIEGFTPDRALRITGLLLVALGLAIIWIV